MICFPIYQSKRDNKYIVTHVLGGGNLDVRMDMGKFLSNKIVTVNGKSVVKETYSCDKYEIFQIKCDFYQFYKVFFF